MRLPTNWGGIASDIAMMAGRPVRRLWPQAGPLHQAVPPNAPEGPPVPMRQLPPSVPATHTGPPASASGNYAAGQLDLWALQLEARFAAILNDPATSIASRASTASTAMQTLYKLQAAWAGQLEAMGMAGFHFARYCAPAWYAALTKLEGIADDLSAGLASPSAAGDAGSGGPMRGMGLWWPPSEWGMTQEQADAYEVQRAQHAIDMENLQAQADAANPSPIAKAVQAFNQVVSAGGQAMSDMEDTAAQSAKMGMFAVVGLLVLGGYVVYKEAQSSEGRAKLGHQAKGAAHAAGQGIVGAAHVAGAATKAAVLV